MIKINNGDVLDIRFRDIPVIAVYINGQLVWPEEKPGPEPGPDPGPVVILSCYYNGYWIDEYVWTDDTPWVD